MFDTIDIFIEKIRQQALCALNSIKGLMTDAKLKKLYDEYKALVDNVLQNDLKTCSKTEDSNLKAK